MPHVKRESATMAKQPVTRFTVSLPHALMATLDRLRCERGYTNRSEFLRDLLHAELVKQEWHGHAGHNIAVLVIVYHHNLRALADKLTHIQHHSHGTIKAALHVHLSEHACLEVIPLRGSARHVRRVAYELLAVKGVRYGQLVQATTGKTNARAQKRGDDNTP
jgi:CopG family nickel-responsive transcriptional regulator